MQWNRWFSSLTFPALRLLALEELLVLITEQNAIQVCVEEIMFKPWLTQGQTGGVTMAPLFAQPDRQMATGFPLTITHRKEEINSKYKNAPSLPDCDTGASFAPQHKYLSLLHRLRLSVICGCRFFVVQLSLGEQQAHGFVYFFFCLFVCLIAYFLLFFGFQC